MGNYFCGWYCRCQTEDHTLAVIPSIHRAGKNKYCSIQVITDSDAYSLRLPIGDYEWNGDCIRMGSNTFTPTGIRLDIESENWNAKGNLRFGPLTPLGYDIMGPFQFVPFMQCRHSVYSLYHWVEGEMVINGRTYVFHKGLGYMEGDRGRSFPKAYLWTQCSFTQGTVMLSVADIPVGHFHFTGIIGIVYLRGKEYRIATYLGAKVGKITPEKIVIRQGSATLTVMPKTVGGQSLLAPEKGCMGRFIREQLACPVRFRFEKGGKLLLDLNAPNAALEYEY